MPALLAFIISVAMFKRRVGGVYFAIITQAIAAILTILIIGQQGYTGGVNGMTDLKTPARLGHSHRLGEVHPLLRVRRAAVRRGLRRALRAAGASSASCCWRMRDKEERVRFSGYDVGSFKVFVFTLAAIFSAIGGALFTLQVGFMSPSFVGIVPSIEMVIFTAVGGRASILGAIYGRCVVNWAKTFFSESFPQLWLLFMGGLFIARGRRLPERARGACSNSTARAREARIGAA